LAKAVCGTGPECRSSSASAPEPVRCWALQRPARWRASMLRACKRQYVKDKLCYAMLHQFQGEGPGPRARWCANVLPCRPQQPSRRRNSLRDFLFQSDQVLERRFAVHTVLNAIRCEALWQSVITCGAASGFPGLHQSFSNSRHRASPGTTAERSLLTGWQTGKVDAQAAPRSQP
jgi:hypothetical protein